MKVREHCKWSVWSGTDLHYRRFSVFQYTMNCDAVHVRNLKTKRPNKLQCNTMFIFKWITTVYNLVLAIIYIVTESCRLVPNVPNYSLFIKIIKLGMNFIIIHILYNTGKQFRSLNAGVAYPLVYHQQKLSSFLHTCAIMCMKIGQDGGIRLCRNVLKDIDTAAEV